MCIFFWHVYFYQSTTKINIYIVIYTVIIFNNKTIDFLPYVINMENQSQIEGLSMWCYIKESYPSNFTTKLCKTEAVTDTRLENATTGIWDKSQPLWPPTISLK